MVEIGRFLLTAVAVSLTVPAILLFALPPFLGTFEMYVFVAVVGLGLSILGGALVGIPVWWLARRWNWDRSLARMTVLGALAGASTASLTMLPFATYDLFGISLWAGLGALGGIVAGPVWVLLHRSDVDPA